ncbi:MAG: 4a-hydroxytetrahydrobiopterin dehydratase [Elusimicrobia bacterium]|nr:4a-hydroxytetrahydrobiopterin dehydratase [Elusimicrobiota bacterium]
MAQACNLDDLTKKKCVPCEGGIPALSGAQAQDFLKALPGWMLAEDAKSISKQWLMKDFVAAVELIGDIRNVAEADDHHPDLHLTGFRKLSVELSTHAIGGLSENDFILAAKIEKLPKELKKA